MHTSISGSMHSTFYAEQRCGCRSSDWQRKNPGISHPHAGKPDTAIRKTQEKRGSKLSFLYLLFKVLKALFSPLTIFFHLNQHL